MVIICEFVSDTNKYETKSIYKTIQMGKDYILFNPKSNIGYITPCMYMIEKSVVFKKF